MKRKKSLAVLGTGSDVGKSILAAGLCRILSRHRTDLSVAPFKGQNMSNNAYPALTQQGDYGEIGIAQAIQARACRHVPVVEVRKYRCVGVPVRVGLPILSRASSWQQQEHWEQMNHPVHTFFLTHTSLSVSVSLCLSLSLSVSLR